MRVRMSIPTIGSHCGWWKRLRTRTITGSPLAAEVTEWVYAAEQVHAEDLARSIAVAIAGGEALFLVLAGLLLFQHQTDVAVDHVAGRAVRFNAAVQQQNGAVGKLLDQAQVMGDEQHGDFALTQLLELAHAAIGEHGIAHGQRLVDDEDLGVHVDGRGEGQPHVHAARIFLDRAGDEVADLGEGLDGRHGALDLGAGEPHNFAVEKDVLAPGEFGIEACAQLEQRRDAPARYDAPEGGLQDAADDLQQRAFAAAVGTDEAECLALFHLEADVAQRPEIAVKRGGREGEYLPQAVRRAFVELVKLGYVLQQDHKLLF